MKQNCNEHPKRLLPGVRVKLTADFETGDKKRRYLAGSEGTLAKSSPTQERHIKTVHMDHPPGVIHVNKGDIMTLRQ